MAKKKQSIEDILDSLREQIDLLEDKINDIEQCECDSDEDIEEDEDEDEDEDE
jgi:prefoldin subunit 5